MYLLGDKHIKSIHVSEDQAQIAFEIAYPRGYVVFEVDADCCSESWFADIIGTAALLGNTVDGVEKVLDGEDPEDDRTRQEFDAAYSYKLKTHKGICEIIFRNSSNGYYGGWINGGNQVDDLDLEGWEKITDDWSA